MARAFGVEWPRRALVAAGLLCHTPIEGLGASATRGKALRLYQTVDFQVVVEGHLSWAREVIWDQISADDQLRLMDELEEAARRASDPCLYVSMFGEFSSGKSTLLNALLGESLLPSSALVTTSVPTVLRPGEASRLGIRRGSNGDWLRLGEAPFRTWYRRVVGRAPPMRAGTALRALLTSKDAAAELAEIEVGVPRAVLGSDVVLVDTPGFNATDARHHELARAAARRTDLAVVVVPATAPVSMSLGDFLTDALAEQLDRCVFVLTKGRLVDDDDQPDLLRWTARRLRDVGIVDPLVLEAPSADEALKAWESGQRDGPAVEQLTELAAALADFAAQHHEAAVEQSIRALLSDLMTSMHHSASAEREQLTRAERELASMRVTHLERFLETWAGPAKDAVRRTVLDVPRPMPLGTPELTGEVEQRVRAATSAEQLRTLAHELSGMVTRHMGAEAKKLVARQAKAARAVLAAAREDLGADFSREYARLVELSGGTLAPVQLRTRVRIGGTTVDVSHAFTTTVASSSKLVTDQNLATGAGAGVGAVIGTILLPGIGTVIGGFLGALFGGVSETKRAAFLTEVKRAIGQAEDTVAAAVRRDLGALAEQGCAEVDRVVEAYTDAFAADVRELAAEEARRRKTMAEQIEAATAVIEESRRRRAELEGRSR